MYTHIYIYPLQYIYKYIYIYPLPCCPSPVQILPHKQQTSLLVPHCGGPFRRLRMCVGRCVYVCVCVRAPLRLCVRIIYIHIHTHTHTSARAHTHTHTHLRLCVRACGCAHAFVHVRISVPVFPSICLRAWRACPYYHIVCIHAYQVWF